MGWLEDRNKWILWLRDERYRKVDKVVLILLFVYTIYIHCFIPEAVPACH